MDEEESINEIYQKKANAWFRQKTQWLWWILGGLLVGGAYLSLLGG